ncbi:MAG: efflux RND transporter periplasmic adaptor subunit [Marinifilaceae bacterium]
MKKELLYILLPLIAGCKSTTDNNTTPTAAPQPQTENNVVIFTDAQVKTANIKWDTLHTANLAHRVECSGEIIPGVQANAYVSMPYGGIVNRILVTHHQSVQQGQPLAIISDAEYITMQQEYLEAKTNVNLTQKELQRQQTLIASEATSHRNLQQAENAHESAKAALSAARAKISLLGIDMKLLDNGHIAPVIALKAPISGEITDINVTLGGHAQAGEAMFLITRTSDNLIELKVYEKDIPHINCGDIVEYTTVGQDKHLHTATITSISSVVNNDNRAITVLAKPTTNNAVLKQGMFINATINTSPRDVKVVPERSIVGNENEKGIFTVINDTTFRFIPVQIGDESKGLAELINAKDIKTNQRIVTHGAYYIESLRTN